jgi:CarboxypepD_reg-like domain/TonB-dependent Receptor Plug Domain
MKIFARLLLFILLCSSLACAQGILSGTITEEESKQPLAGAYVLLQGTTEATITNERGDFQFLNVKEGTYQVQVSFIGFETIRQAVQITDQQRTVLSFQLPSGNVELADVVISANTSVSVNMLSPVDIKLRSTNSSQDILRMVPGLFIAQHAGGGKAEQIFLRGFDIDHGTDINLEVDGLPVNMVSHAHGQGYSDLHFLIPEIVSLVDFDKGPYYADKGDFTTAGFVSFKTKTRLEKNFVKLEGGLFGTTRAVAGVNIGNKAYVATEYFLSDGYFESPQDFNRLNVTAKYSSAINAKNHVSVGASYFTSRWDASGQVPQRAIDDGSITRFGAIDNTEGGETSRANVFAKFSHQLSDRSSVEQQAYAIRYDFNLYSNFTFFLNDPVNGDQIQQHESRMIYGYKTTFKTDGFLFGKEMKTEIGAGLRYDDVSDIFLANTIKRVFLSDVQRGDLQEANINAHVNETLTLNHHWSVNAAIRFDAFTFGYDNKLTEKSKVRKASIISPKLSVNYQINDNILVYVRNGFGFHSNDARVVLDETAKEILPRAFGTDVGMQTKISDKLLLNVAFWRLDLDQEFVYVGDGGIVEPSGKSLREGIDLSARYQLFPWLFADLDLNMTKPRAKAEPEGQDYIPLAPTFTSIGGFSFKMQNGVNGSLRYRYIADRAANEDKSVIADGYFLSDVVLNYTRKKYELGISVENIFNTEWKEAQFDTESRLMNEVESVSEIHFTPGIPLFAKARISFFF